MSYRGIRGRLFNEARTCIKQSNRYTDSPPFQSSLSALRRCIRNFETAIALVHSDIMIMLGIIPMRSMIAPKSGAPGRMDRTEGRAKSAYTKNIGFLSTLVSD
jgi:hypothetical protein